MNLSVLIHTFNGYQHLWPGCLKAWGNIPAIEPVDFFFGTDLPTEYGNISPFMPMYSGQGPWSDRLRALLRDIKTDYVLYCQEDHYPTGYPPIFSDLMRIMRGKDLFRLQISPIVEFYSLYGSEMPLFFHEKSKYLVSHQPSIWKKSFLLECLKPGEDPWKNEYEGSRRLNNDPKIREKIAIYPCDWYKHMCIKGRVVEP